MSQNSTETTNQGEKFLTSGQRQNYNLLKTNFGLSDAELDRCIFFRQGDDEPWIPPDILEAIARQSGGFQQISSIHDKYIAQLEQVLYIATVVDGQARSYTRSGAARLGEKPNGRVIDTDILAAGRALGAALTAAGFNPFRAGSVVDFKPQPETTYSGPDYPSKSELYQVEDEASLRLKDLRQIHTIAEKKGLIVGRDLSRYRNELAREYGKRTAAGFDAPTRTSVINWLNNYDSEFFTDLPLEMQPEAMIA